MPRPQGPLDPTEGVMQQFAADLRRLREQAGNPGYRELARHAHFSAAALSTAAAGKKLPTLAVTLAYAQACGGNRAEWETRWHTVAAELAPAEQQELTEAHGSPYVGLASFQPHDADRFFGREHLVEELTHQVNERRFTAVFGPSGSGKSSLLRAGLIPALSADHADWPVVLLTPGEHPLAECAAHLARLLHTPASTVLADLTADPHHLHLAIRQALIEHPKTVDLLLVVDQFEEVFALCPDTSERRQFIAALLAAAQASTSRTRVVLGVRTDFYGNCAHHPDLVEALRDGQTLVGPMHAEELRAAITRPAARAGLSVEATLVATIITEMLGRAGALPLMSHCLVETWRRRRGTTLSLAGYHASGGIDSAVAQTAERTYTALTTDQQHAARDLMLRLTRLGDNTEDTRRRIPTNELDHDDPAVAHTLDAFTRARLLTVGENTIEIAHEALIHAWPRLRDWLTDDRDAIHTHHRLTDATRIWESLDRDTGALYRGVQLATAQAWHTRRRTTTLTTSEQDFLTASLTAHAQERRTRRRGASLLVALAAAVTVLAGVTVAASINAAQHPPDSTALSRDSHTATATARRTIPVSVVDARAAALTRQLSDAHLAILSSRAFTVTALADSAARFGHPVPPLEFVVDPGKVDNSLTIDGVPQPNTNPYIATASLVATGTTDMLDISITHVQRGAHLTCQFEGSGYVEYECAVQILSDGTQVKTFEAASGGVPGTTNIGHVIATFMEAIRPDGTYTTVQDITPGANNPDLTTAPLLTSHDLVSVATVFTY